MMVNHATSRVTALPVCARARDHVATGAAHHQGGITASRALSTQLSGVRVRGRISDVGGDFEIRLV